MLTFIFYLITLFDTRARLILFTLVPASLMGAVLASFVRAFGWSTLRSSHWGRRSSLAWPWRSSTPAYGAMKAAKR
jgi:hypothetical protein